MSLKRLGGSRKSKAANALSYGRTRQGIALIVVLAALTIVVGVLLPLIPPALRARRQVELEEVALQNEFLKSAVTQRLLQSPVPETNSDEELSKWSGQLNFGREGSLHGEWFVRRQQQSGTETGELEVVVRLEFNETAESGSSPWTIPKTEVAFTFPAVQEAETKQ